MALAESLGKDNSNAWGNKCSGKQVDMYIPFLQIKGRELVKGLSFFLVEVNSPHGVS